MSGSHKLLLPVNQVQSKMVVSRQVSLWTIIENGEEGVFLKTYNAMACDLQVEGL